MFSKAWCFVSWRMLWDMRSFPLIHNQRFCTFVYSAIVYITKAKFYFERDSSAATIELNELMDLINFVLSILTLLALVRSVMENKIAKRILESHSRSLKLWKRSLNLLTQKFSEFEDLGFFIVTSRVEGKIILIQSVL